MFSRNIPLNTIDFTGKRQDNLVEGEYYRRLDTSTDESGIYDGLEDITFVPRTGPFYTDSLVLTKPDGTVLVEGTHYELFGIATALTAFIKDKEVGMFVNMIDETVTEWFASYQVVGHFGIMNQDLVNLVNGAVDDDRPIYYKNIRNKPKWFNPELHLHDLRWGIHSFQDLVDGIKSIRELKGNIRPRMGIAITHFNDVIMSHIDDFERMLLNYIRQHDGENVEPYGNSHGLTAEQMKLEKVDNYETATLLDIIDGFRKDRHVTVDLVKRAVDLIGKDTDNLVKVGSLPILRYGSNSFIPAPIQGSYEGMGGNNFNVGLNIESNGEAVMLMNRNDGRVNSLYFMNNSAPNFAATGWNFTAYKYSHQTADAEGVKLRNVIRGSNGKFLIVGGPDANGKQVWYQSLGNGTFDPLRHKLIRIPNTVDVNSTSMLCTEAFPTRVLLFTRYSHSAIFANQTYRELGFDTPASSGLSGVSLPAAFAGFKAWEYSLSEQVWRPIIFTYNQCGETTKITSEMYMPFRTVIKEVSAENPRADGAAYKYGLKQFEYIFDKLITSWEIRNWYECILGIYDDKTDYMYIKYMYTSVGSDNRSAPMEGGTNSLGFIFKNRNLSSDGILNYDIENRKSLTQMYTVNTSKIGSGSGAGNVVESPGKNPHSEWVQTGLGYNGGRTLMWLGTKRLFSIGSIGYDTFPVSIGYKELNGQAAVENPENWVNDRIDTNVNNSYATYTNYNEENPAYLFIGAHSTCWLPINPDDPNTFGSISVGTRPKDKSTNLWFRRHPVLNANGYPNPPSKIYKLYEALDGTGLDTIGYDLNNEVYPIYNNITTCFVTNIFYPSSDNRKSEYQKHLVGHQPFPVGSGNVKNSTANTTVGIEWEMVEKDNGYTVVATKSYNLDDALKNVLIPYMEKNYLDAVLYTTVPNEYTSRKLSFVNALATMRIGYTNLRSAKYENLMIFSFMIFTDDPDNTAASQDCRVWLLNTAFNISGGTEDENGIVQNATVTPVGKIHAYLATTARSDMIRNYCTENYQFQRGTGTSTIQSRDLVHQFENGLTHVNMQWDLIIAVKGNNSSPGVSLLVSEDGIVDLKSFTTYWTSGQYYWFHHPYYGCVNRQNWGIYTRRSAGPSEVGTRYAINFDKFTDHTDIRDHWILGTSNYLESYFTVYFSVSLPITVSGKEYEIASSYQNLEDIVPDPRNKTFYVYLDYGEQGPYYHITLTPISETPSRGLISVVKTNNDAIYSIENYNVFTMNGIRISTIRHGSVIPAATGSIETTGQLEGWVTKNRE